MLQTLTQQALMPPDTLLETLNEVIAPSNSAMDVDDYLNMPLSNVRYRIRPCPYPCYTSRGSDV
ncbi:hypothetical protein ACLUEY_09970 [Vreelandella aquamarina]